VKPLVGPYRVRGPLGPGAWDAWDTRTGERVLLGAEGVASPPFSCTLADLLPAEAEDPVWAARVALGVLERLTTLHAAGHAHGRVAPERVLLVRNAWTLADLGQAGSPLADLRAFGALLVELGDPSLAELGVAFAETPPPSAGDAARLVVAACAAELARAHHALVQRARLQDRGWRVRRLVALAARLGAACPPPVANGVVREEPDGVRLTLRSDGATVSAARLHPGAPVGDGFLVAADGVLDPVSARAVLRAWATSPNRDAGLAPLARWLTAAGRLRFDRRLLERGYA
jgi:hypothetical protein